VTHGRRNKRQRLRQAGSNREINERLVEDHLLFRDEHRQLLNSQLILTDIAQKQAETLNTFQVTLNTLQETMKRVVEEKFAQLAEAQKNADDRMPAFILAVDDIIRRPPPQER